MEPSDNDVDIANTSSEARRTGRFSAREYRPGDGEAIRALYHQVIGSERSAEDWAWRNHQASTGPARIIIVEDGARLVAHMASIRRWVWVEGTAVASNTGHDLMVAAEHRGSGAYDTLIDYFLSIVPPHCFSLGFASDAAIRATRRWGGLPLGRMPQWVRALGPGAGPLWRRTGRRALAVAGSGLALAGGRPSLEAISLEDLGPEVDDLASESRTWWPCGVVRYAAYLRWRFQAQPGRQWRIRAVRDPHGRLKGLGVHGVREPGVGWVADLLAPDAATTHVLLADAVEGLRHDGCYAVFCWYLDPRPWARQSFRAAGFVRYGSGGQIVLVPRTSCPPVAARLDSWFLTAGDSSVV